MSAGDCAPDASAPADRIAGSSLSTAATGAAEPSSAQFSPPNAIIDVPMAVCANTTASPRLDAPPAADRRERPEHRHVRADDQQQAPHDRLLAQPCGLVLQRVKQRASRDEAIERPLGETEETQLFRGWRIDGEAVGVLGVALRGADLGGVAVAPDGALAQQPVRRQPHAAQARSAPTTRTPQARSREAIPPNSSTSPPAMKSMEMTERRSGHSEVEVARDGQVARERGSSRCPMPGGRTHASVSRS